MFKDLIDVEAIGKALGYKTPARAGTLTLDLANEYYRQMCRVSPDGEPVEEKAKWIKPLYDSLCLLFGSKAVDEELNLCFLSMLKSTVQVTSIGECRAPRQVEPYEEVSRSSEKVFNRKSERWETHYKVWYHIPITYCSSDLKEMCRRLFIGKYPWLEKETFDMYFKGIDDIFEEEFYITIKSGDTTYSLYVPVKAFALGDVEPVIERSRSYWSSYKDNGYAQEMLNDKEVQRVLTLIGGNAE